MTIEKSKPWERPSTGPAEWDVEGDDATLAAVVRDHAGARIAYSPSADSDLARTLGGHGRAGTMELPLDALRVTADGRQLFGVNMLVVGVAPDRATWHTRSPALDVHVDGRLVHTGRALAVVVANGQFLRGRNLVPRGHPGDGRAEVQVYTVSRSQRAAVRSRSVQGVHLPHPQIVQTTGRRIEIVGGAPGGRDPAALELDGVALQAASRVDVSVASGAYSLLV